MAVYKRYKRKKVLPGDKNYKKGTWYAAGMVDGTRYKKALKTAKTKKDAEAEEDLIVSKIRYGEFELFKDKTKFSDFVDDIYLPYCKVNNEWYKTKVYETNRLKKFFGNLKLKAITPSKIEEYKSKRLSETVECQRCKHNSHSEGDTCNPRKVSNGTVNHELSTLRKLLNVAVQNRKLTENPMKFVKLLPKTKPRERFLSADEKSRLFAAIGDNNQLMAITLIGLSTGWRKGQILSLKRSDLDFENKTVDLTKSKKTKARKVLVSEFTWNLLAELADTAKENKTDWLFYNKRTSTRLKGFDKPWRAALKKAEIDNFHFHDLRHTFATDLLELGAGSFMIQSALGHADIKMTKIYAHVKNRALKEQLDKVGEKQNPSNYPTFTPPDEK